MYAYQSDMLDVKTFSDKFIFWKVKLITDTIETKFLNVKTIFPNSGSNNINPQEYCSWIGCVMTGQNYNQTRITAVQELAGTPLN